MPKRVIPLRNQEIYHVFNRGIDKRVTFGDTNEYKRAIVSMNYYAHKAPSIKLSLYLTTSPSNKLKNNDSDSIVNLISYCFMPNHFHFLLQQAEDGGVSKFLSNFQNSYTRYFNTKNKRTGPLFLTQFKAVKIENENQLIHINRYIHLNPFSSRLVNTENDLISYPWSSLATYLSSNNNQQIEKGIILSHFRSVYVYKKFVLNQAGYQRSLKKVEKLLLED